MKQYGIYQHCLLVLIIYNSIYQTPLSEAGSLSEGAAAFDVIAAGGPLSIDTGDLGELDKWGWSWFAALLVL